MWRVRLCAVWRASCGAPRARGRRRAGANTVHTCREPERARPRVLLLAVQHNHQNLIIIQRGLADANSLRDTQAQDGWTHAATSYLRSCLTHLTPHSTSGILCLQLLRHLPLALVDGVGPLERVRFALGALCAAEARCAGEVGCTLPVRRPRSLSPPYFSRPALACTWHTSICECLDAFCRNILHGLCAHRHAVQQPFDHLLRRGVLVQKVFALCTDTPGGAWRRKLGACVAWCVRAAPPPGSSQPERARS